MKHLKAYEENNEEYQIDDYIILHEKEAYRIWRIFNVVKIIDKNCYDKKFDMIYKYKIEAIVEDNPMELEIKEYLLKTKMMHSTGYNMWKQNLFIERKATINEIKEFEDKKNIILGHKKSGISQNMTKKYNI
jgi:hypothetical protein